MRAPRAVLSSSVWEIPCYGEVLSQIFEKNKILFQKFGQKMCVYKKASKKWLRKKIRSNFLWKFSFLKFYVMGATEIDFGGIAHVKVGVIAHQKI